MLNPQAEGNQVARYRIGPEGEQVQFHKEDDYTVVAELPVPYGVLTRVLSHADILPKHKLEDYVDEDDPGAVNEAWTTGEDLENIVGTGPFHLEEYVVDQKVVMARNPPSLAL